MGEDIARKGAVQAKVALAALKGDKTLAELAEKYDVHGSQITQWKAQLLKGEVRGQGGPQIHQLEEARRGINMIIKALLLALLTLFCSQPFAEEKPNETSSSFLGKLFGKQEDFTDLKKQRRQLIAEITRLERDIGTLEFEAKQLTTQLENAPSELGRLSIQIGVIDRLIAEKTAAAQPGAKPPLKRPTSPTAFADETEYLASRTVDDLRGRRTDIEQRIKAITERQQRLATNRDEQRKKRDELEIRQARLVELEDRIGVALSTGTNQYVYRTVVSLIYAAIVAFLVLQFFRVVQQNEEVRKSIFTGDTGIQFITLFSIVIAVILFGILEILGANELSALLGGLSGYILGKSSSRVT